MHSKPSAALMKRPAGQNWHWVLRFVGVKPRGHAVHSFAFGVVDIELSGHGEHLVAFTKEPGEHLVCAATFVRSAGIKKAKMRRMRGA